MANLKEVKARISSVTSTQKITKAMKMVSAAKLRHAQGMIIHMRPFSEKLTGILSKIFDEETASDTSLSPYMENRKVNRVLLVVISSDRGLCGGFNNNVFKKTKELIDKEYSHLMSSGTLDILPIGKKSYEFFKKRNYKLVSDYYQLLHELTFENSMKVTDYIMSSFASEKYDEVKLVYNEFKNIATQMLKTEQFLPVVNLTQEAPPHSNEDYILEPSKDHIFVQLIPKILKIQFYKALLDSNASEHGARMTAMDQASENADEILGQLRLTYNSTRQAAITKEILEIVSGAEALANK